MSLKVFYADYCEDKILEPHNARIATVNEILHSMDCVLHIPGNFLGLIDKNDLTLQFMVNENNTICVDIPIPSERGSLMKSTDLQECLNIVRRIESTVNVDEIDGLEFQPW